MNQIKTQFIGLNLTCINEPAQALLDECVFQYEHRLIRYIEPAKSNSRETEVMAGKSDRKLRIEANSLSVKESKNVPDEDVGTAYKLQQCLRRRAVGYAFANLISFECHERFIDRLMRRLNAEPPAYYQARSCEQTGRFGSICRRTLPRSGLERMEQNPWTKRWTMQCRTMKLLFICCPCLCPHSPPLHQFATGIFQQGTLISNPRGQTGALEAKEKAKLNSTNKVRAQHQGVSREQLDVTIEDVRRALCFNFNLSECADAPIGGACKRGRHVCFKANCFKAHAFCTARKDGMPKQGQD